MTDRLFFILSALMWCTVAADDNTSLNRMYDAVWVLAWIAAIGVLIYLLFPYPYSDVFAAQAPRKAEDNVINVRIINPLPVPSNGRAVPAQSSASS